MTRMTRFAVTFIVTAGGLLAARGANAQATDAGTTTCASLTNPVYVDGSSAFVPTAGAFAVKLANSTANKMTIVYTSPGSCAGINDIATNHPLAGTGTYFTGTAAAPTKNSCTLATTQTADLAISDVFYGSCGTAAPATQPATLKDFPGPAQAMEFIVPSANITTKYITAAEANVLYNLCGATGGISTFSSAMGIFCRDQNSGTQIIIASNIGLPAASLTMCQSVSGGAMPGDVSGYSMPQASIGFVGADIYDANRSSLGALAFQASGQTAAYYADSTPSARDRQNVRDGHYTPWGYEHMFAYVDATGTPTNANAAKLINVINGVVSDAAVGDPVLVEATAGTIPVCAMGVQKTDDAPGYMTKVTPTCTCAYLKAATGTAPSTCVACGGGSDGGADAAAGSCTGGKTCQHGFCE